MQEELKSNIKIRLENNTIHYKCFDLEEQHSDFKYYENENKIILAQYESLRKCFKKKFKCNNGIDNHCFIENIAKYFNYQLKKIEKDENKLVVTDFEKDKNLVDLTENTKLAILYNSRDCYSIKDQESIINHYNQEDKELGNQKYLLYIYSKPDKSTIAESKTGSNHESCQYCGKEITNNQNKYSSKLSSYHKLCVDLAYNFSRNEKCDSNKYWKFQTKKINKDNYFDFLEMSQTNKERLKTKISCVENNIFYTIPYYDMVEFFNFYSFIKINQYFNLEKFIIDKSFTTHPCSQSKYNFSLINQVFQDEFFDKYLINKLIKK